MSASRSSSSRRRNLVFGAIGLVVVVLTFAVVLPRIADYREVWKVLAGLEAWWIAALVAVVAVNVVTYAPPWMVALPGLRFRQALPFTQASTAFTYVAPGGGLVGMAGSYGLLRSWGFGAHEVARAVTLTGIWNQLANLLLPVVGVFLLQLEDAESALLATAALVGAVVFTVAVGAFVVILWSDEFAGAVGEVAERLATWLLRRVRRGPVSGWPDALVRFRRDTVDLVRRRWAPLTVTALVGNLAVFAVLLVSLRALGIGSDELTWIEAFAGWALARALQLIPLTPGGIGPVEIGLTSILVGFGGPNAAVVAAVLLYRVLTIVPTLLLGLATIVGWRWLGPDRRSGGVGHAAGKRRVE